MPFYHQTHIEINYKYNQDNIIRSTIKNYVLNKYYFNTRSNIKPPFHIKNHRASVCWWSAPRASAKCCRKCKWRHHSLHTSTCRRWRHRVTWWTPLMSWPCSTRTNFRASSDGSVAKGTVRHLTSIAHPPWPLVILVKWLAKLQSCRICIHKYGHMLPHPHPDHDWHLNNQKHHKVYMYTHWVHYQCFFHWHALSKYIHKYCFH